MLESKIQQKHVDEQILGDMEKTGEKRDYKEQEKSDQVVVVREYESRDELEVRRIFSEGMLEMIQDTAFRGLRHHPESLLLYLALTVACLWMSRCGWVIILLPGAILCGRFLYSSHAIHSYLKHAMNTDMADIEGFYMKSPGSCLWVAVLDGEVVGLVAALVQQRSRDVVELRRMSVDRRYRSRGVGMALGRKVLEFASTCGFSKVFLGTTAYQLAAHKLYQRLGFRCVGVTNGYRSAAVAGPSLLEWVFYRVSHHHYMLEVQHREINDLNDRTYK